MIALEAYAADCRLFGLVDPGDGRLTEFLNASPDVRFQDALLESLADGHVTEAPELVVAHDELCAVIASGTRGDTSRRLRTHAVKVEVVLGPYQIVGEVHGTPASDPLRAVLNRPAWVPLTRVTVTYMMGSESVEEDMETLVVNRNLARSFRAADELNGTLPWDGPRASRHAVPGSLDLTGTLRDD